jgi:hypothetical protein
MKLYFTLKENNRLDSFSYFPMETAEGETQYEIETDVEFDKLSKCEFVDGELIYNSEYEIEDVKRKLRIKRERECFPYINRGQLWYTQTVNTSEKMTELTDWYQAWLDVTDTLEAPVKPSWLD